MFAKDVITEEWLADVLQDSLEMDWTSTDGARAIMRALEDGLVELPQRGGQVASRFYEDEERVSGFKSGWEACEAWWQGGHTGDPDMEFSSALLEHFMLAAAPKAASTPDAAASEAGEVDAFRDLERAPLAALHRLQHTGSPAAKPKLGGSILQWAADEIAALRAALSTQGGEG